MRIVNRGENNGNKYSFPAFWLACLACHCFKLQICKIYMSFDLFLSFFFVKSFFSTNLFLPFVSVLFYPVLLRDSLSRICLWVGLNSR